ncbi:XylR family transcriptional regulator [Alteromonas sp. RKMC-009]|uniref:XylR family transcriptional regulator n=1 Tax=Alteromonas sp. RKMC-009 TaxID=2267264 RepID=UPI000C355586|nr:DNA-binding transcriptional regulator [Alteromonas sp. RKMC-009]AYA65988.1 DNA-binding transcriptional regulator [Alteromonas sp. RKMC-009]MBT81302.1 XylR family transcriptional regulator [Alteromonadaceae bacterium]MEC7691968.1 DNA-binding transcriptional regulator [Pseudomonadota bacterium]
MFEKSHSITLLFNASKVYDRQIIEGIGRYLQTSKADWDLYLEEDFMTRLEHLDEWSGNGIIADFDNPAIEKALTKARVPVVAVGGSYQNKADYPQVPYVATDNFALVEAAFEHLKQKGIEQFAFYGAPLDSQNRWAHERERAMLELTRREGYECFVYRGHAVRPETWQYSLKRLTDWLNSLPEPTGIVAVTDARARHLLQACDHLGLLIPERYSVIGIDDDELARYLSRVSLTSVKQGCFDMGFQAARMLHRQLQGLPVSKAPVLVPPERVAERQSTDYKAIKDPLVMQAMHFIRHNACRGIKVDQVLDYVGISRSNLEGRFKEERGHSIHTEIHNEKLSRACKMLKETDEAAVEIAEICGYPSIQYMYAIFRKHFNQTPVEYRQAHRPQSLDDLPVEGLSKFAAI